MARPLKDALWVLQIKAAVGSGTKAGLGTMKKQSNLWVWFFTALVLLVVIINLFAARDTGVVQAELTYSGFKDLVAAGNVDSVVIEGEKAVARLKAPAD